MEKDLFEEPEGRDVCSDAEQILGIGDQDIGVCTLYASVLTGHTIS